MSKLYLSSKISCSTNDESSVSLNSLGENILNYVKNDNEENSNIINNDYVNDVTNDETAFNNNNERESIQIEIKPDYLEVDISDLDFYERCGNGAYGCVYRAFWISRNKEVAVKRLLQLENEADVLSKLSHRNIIRFFGVVSKTPNCCLITEYAENGSLQAYIHSNKLDIDLILQWAKDIALGMNYLHEEACCCIIHRDLKSTNVVISKDMVCKLCDFGTSTFSFKTTKMSLIGTFPWMSPEIIQGKEVNKKCDIWSYGVVLWELVTGQLPFKGLESFQIAYLVIEREQRLPIPNGCPKTLGDLMEFCWKIDPKSRPSFKYIIETLEQCCTTKEKADIKDQFDTHKAEWEAEIENVFEKLKKIEQDLSKKEKILNERERKLREQELNLINNFKIITIEDYDINTWREVDVYEWVKKICKNHNLDISIANLFMDNNVNGHSLLKLNKDDLIKIGIKVGPAVSIYDEIEHIKRENTRLLHFPPLKNAPSIISQTSTKDITFNVFLSAHIIPGNKPDDHKWQLFLNIDDTDENKELNSLLFIHDVKFVSRTPPFTQFNVNKPPYVMPKWVKGIPPNSKVDCIITYDDKVIKPRSSKIEFNLNAENNSTIMQEVTITIENNDCSEPTSTTSTQSFNTIHHSSSNSDVWKNRQLENAYNEPPINNKIKDCNDRWSGIVKGKYKTDEDNQPKYKSSSSCNELLSNNNSNANSTTNCKFKRFNTAIGSIKHERRPLRDFKSNSNNSFKVKFDCNDSDTQSNAGSVASNNSNRSNQIQFGRPKNNNNYNRNKKHNNYNNHDLNH